MCVCRKCGNELTSDNWYPSHKKLNIKRCRTCHNAVCRSYASANKDKGRANSKKWSLINRDKIRAREKNRPKIVDLHRLSDSELGKRCAKCECELTIDSWLPSARKRRIRRCRECHKKICKDWAKRNPENQRRRTARWRLRNPEYGQRKYRENISQFKERARISLWNVKSRAFLILGGKCACCGNDDIRVLQVNHKNGGGTQEKRHGAEMYKAIIDGIRLTDDLDLRCANCNLIYEYERGKRSLPEGVDPHLTHITSRKIQA